MRRMAAIANHRRSTAHHRAVFALVCVVVAHQFVMLLPMHEQVMQMLAPAPHSAMTEAHECAPCPPPVVMRQCAATEAVFRVLDTLIIAGIILALLVAPVMRPSWSRLAAGTWLWPPNRRRAFLQVFLC